MARQPISKGRWPTWPWLKPSFRIAICQDRHLHGQGIGDHRQEVLAVDAIDVLGGDLPVSLRHELREAAGGDEGVEVLVLGQDVGHLLHL